MGVQSRTSMRSAGWTGARPWLVWFTPVLLVSAALRVLASLGTGPRIAGDTPEYLHLAHQLGSLDCSGRGYLDTDLPYAATSVPC